MIWEGAHVEARLPVRDLERARAWYRDKLGLEATEERPGGLRYVFGATEFALFTSSGAASGDHTQMGFYVEDIDAAVADLRERGVDLDEFGGVVEIEGNYPSKGSGERAAWFRDIDGNLVGLAQLVP
jgi:catechol 2,3-dioxygenase-like lactoylglutathione lyase family enzyme